MPYIAEEKRMMLEHALATLAAGIIVEDPKEQAGVLNYCITSLLNEVLKTNGLKYRNINELIGVLECAKLELYRRVASPYEDVKKDSNGDVY
jgi:hypothetical protein|tara:strand:+ start:350 stop:625 length:276 start_codon:yes stop_codon:yes gene_type:complete